MTSPIISFRIDDPRLYDKAKAIMIRHGLTQKELMLSALRVYIREVDKKDAQSSWDTVDENYNWVESLLFLIFIVAIIIWLITKITTWLSGV